MFSNHSKHLISITFEGGTWVVVNSNIWWISFTSKMLRINCCRLLKIIKSFIPDIIDLSKELG